MKIEWSEDFKKRCAEADKALREDPGCFLEVAENCLEDTSIEDDFDKLDQGCCVYYDLEDWTLHSGPVGIRVECIELYKEDIANWDDYYAYRKTMFRLEKTA